MKPSFVKKLSRLFPNFFTSRTKNPVFIIGAARSGTTLLRNLLSQVDRFFVSDGENNHLWHPNCYPYIQSRDKEEVPPHWFDVKQFSKKSLELRTEKDSRYIQAYFGAFSFFSGKDYFINKSAMLTQMIPYVDALFPGARYIHIERDIYSVIRSDTERTFRKIRTYADEYERLGYLFDYEELLEILTNHVVVQLKAIDTEIANGRLKEGVNYCHIEYETLCEEPERSMKKIFEFLEMDPSVCLDQMDFSKVESRNYKAREMDPKHVEIIENTLKKIRIDI